MTRKLLTSVVGSYPQPDSLIDRALLTKMMAPRVRVQEVWRVPPERLEQAQDEATLEAIRDQERAGVDIITDGEIRRESYSNKFANALDGIDRDRIGEIVGRTGNKIPVPIVSGPIKRRGPVEVRDVEFLRANTDKTIKITLPGPFTMAQQAVNEYYADAESLALAYAEAVNEEVHDLFAAGADIVQLDEPWLQARAEAARRYGVKAINRALAGARGTTALHLCFGYAALVKDKPASGYSFLAELERLRGEPNLDRGGAAEDRSRRAAGLRSKTVLIGVLDLNDRNVETRASSRDADSRGARGRAARAARRHAGLRDEVSAARCRVRQAPGARRGRRARARGALGATGPKKKKPGPPRSRPLPVARAYMLGIRKDPSPSPLQNVRRNCTGTSSRTRAVDRDSRRRLAAAARSSPRRRRARLASRSRGRTTARCWHRPRPSGC